jgi:hypothetical protein
MRRLIPVAAVAALAALSFPLAAQAAPASVPTAQLSLAASSIKQGGTIRLFYSTNNVPRGSTVRLEGRLAGGTWKLLPGHLAKSGLITEPGSPAGKFQFKLVVNDAGRRVAVSRVATLTVRAAQSSGGHASPSPWWGVLEAGVKGAAEGAAGAAATVILGLLLCFIGIC